MDKEDKNMKKRLLSLLLAVLMIVSLLPTAAFAAVGDGDPVPAVALGDEASPATSSAEAEAPAALAEGEIDFCRPNDGATVTVKTLDADGNEINDCGESGDNFTPASVLSDNYGWDYVGGTKNNPRWISTNTEGGTHILQVDLGTVRRVSSIHLYWFNNNFTGLDVDVSPTESGNDWVNVRTQNSRVLSLLQRLSFTERDVRRIRITMKNADDQGFSTDADGYYDVSLYRVEAYQTEPDIDETVTATPPGDDVNMAEIQEFGHVSQPSGEFPCSSGKAKVDNSIYIRASASSWTSSATSTNQHPRSTSRAGLAFDGDRSTAWTSRPTDAQPWIIVNLGTNRDIKGIKLNFRGSNVKNFKIEGTTNPQGTDWQELYVKDDNVAITAPIAANLAASKAVSFVRLTVTDHTANTSVVLEEMGIYSNEQEADQPVVETPDGNLCRPSDGATVSAEASSVEAGTSFTADKVLDGDTSTKASRWSSANNTATQYITVDLGRERSVSIVKIFWERLNVTAYTLQLSTDNSTWTTVHTCSSRITETEEDIRFSPTAARYIKINVTGHDDQGASGYSNAAIYEVEAYRDEAALPVPPVTAATVVSWLTPSYDQEHNKVVYTVAADHADDPALEDYDVVVSANLEQVVGPDGTVYTPLVDLSVEVALTATSKDNPSDSATTPSASVVSLTIPGEHTANEGNDKPAVIPEIMEWYSSADQGAEAPFQLTENSRIIHRYGAQGGFDHVANELTADLNDLFDLGMTTEKNHVHNLTTYAAIAAAVQPGDIVIYNVLPNGTADNLGKTAGFDDETYRMEITDHVTIFATDATGAYWATRTLLQALKLSDTAGNGLTMDRGTIRDYPEFKVRGLVLDVGRKPESMETLYDIVKNMAWYKMNDFHVHLNDNLIFMEDYYDGEGWQAAYDRINEKAYSAFRLESGLQEESDAIAPLTAKDYHYTKAEYKAFVEDSAKIGVNIVSEIDVPAHAKAITDAFPSLRLSGASGHPWNDHLDLSDAKYAQSLAKVKEIFNEYIDAGIFGSAAHFGADEYYASHPAYRRFVKDMIEYLNGKSNITTKRVWGSLSSMSNDQTQYPASSIPADGIQMNIWNTSWADPQAMYDLGFDLINTQDGVFYMVPNGGGGRGGYGDYLNQTTIYDRDPNKIGNTVFPAGSPQILGSAIAIWMDNIDTRAAGLDEHDVFARFFDALPYACVKMWGEGSDGLDRTAAELSADIEILGAAPNTNPTNEVDLADGAEQYASYDFATTADNSGNHHDLTLQGGAALQDGVLSLPATGNGYAQTGLDRLGWGNKLYFKVRKTANAGADTQILFEADAAYGDYAIKALPGSDDSHWKLGFSRELYDYEFPVDLPVGEWLELTLVNNQLNTVLYVNHGAPVSAVGKFVSNADSNTQFRGKTGITNSSLYFPIARIGSSKPGSSFVGLLNDLTIAPLPEPVENGKYDIPVDQYQAVTAGTAQPGSEADKAIDGNASTVWHTTWSVTCPTDKRWFQFELKEPTLIGGLNYLRSSGSNGAIQTFDIQVSSDGTDWTTVVTDGSFSGQIRWEAVAFPQVTTKYVRLIAKQTGGAQDSNLHIGQFISAAEIRLCTPRDMADVTVSLAAVVYPLTDGKAEPLPTVMFGDEILVKDVDYTVSYANNTQVSSASATASVIVTGKGAYSGQATASFRVTETPVISKTSLADATVTLSADSYPLENGVAQPDPVVKLGETTLLRGLDYTVTYRNNTSAGATATVTITGIGLYSGTKTATFQVAAPLTKKDLSNSRLTTVTLHQLTFVTSGEPITPEPVVVYNGETLVKDVDYTLSYVRNTTPGTATVTVTGIGLCTGSVSINFTIKDAATVKDLSDVTKTQIIFQPEEYAYTGRPIIPTFVVTYNGRRLVRDTDYTVELSNNVNGGNGVVVIRGMGDYYGPFVATFTITGGGTGGNTGGSSSGGSGSGAASGPVTTTTEKRSDGASVTTKTDASGAMTSTATYPDGAKVTADIPVTGPITAVVTVPARADQVTVTIPTRGEPTPGQVAVILHADGTEEIIKTALANEAGLAVTLDASATIQVVDNAKTFVDVPANSWAKDAIVFVTSREIFNGTGSNTFSPNSDMSRAMVCTVLANLAGEDTKAGTTWYEKGLAWAKEQGISDTTAPHSIITREQLAVMLYRYAGSPVVADEVPRRFRDRDSISGWAELAMTWAVQNDLIRGRSSLDGLDLAPQDTATRAEVASVLQRYVALLK